MARTALVPVVPGDGKPLTTVTPVPAASNATDGNGFPCTGRELLLAVNTDSGSHHIRFTSVADAYGRQDPLSDTDITIAAGAYKLFGPFPPSLWKQVDGSVYCKTDDVTVKLLVIKY